MEGYFKAKNIKFILERPNYQESQCVVEIFNNIYQDYNSDCYENDRFTVLNWHIINSVQTFKFL